MDAVYGWVKHIIYYVIFLSIVSSLLADTKYEKYVRFFAGMVLILLVAGPLVNGLGIEEQLASAFAQLSFKQEAADLDRNLLGMEERRREQIMAKYEEAVEEDVARMAREQGLACVSVKADIEQDQTSSRYSQVKALRLTVAEPKKEESGQPGEKKVAVVQVAVGKVADVEVGTEAPGAEGAQSGSVSSGVEGMQSGSVPSEVEGAQSEPVASEVEGAQSETVPSEAGKDKSDPTSPESAPGQLTDFKRKVEQYYELEASDIEIQWEND